MAYPLLRRSEPPRLPQELFGGNLLRLHGEMKPFPIDVLKIDRSFAQGIASAADEG